MAYCGNVCESLYTMYSGCSTHPPWSRVRAATDEKWAALIRTLWRPQIIPHWPGGRVRLAEAGAHNEHAALATLVGFRVDVALAAEGGEVGARAEELPSVCAGVARVETLQHQAWNEARGRAVEEEELVHVDAVKRLHLDRVDVEHGHLLVAEPDLILHRSEVLVLQPPRKDLLDPNDFELGRFTVRVALLRSNVARDLIDKALLEVRRHRVVVLQLHLPGLAVLRVVRETAEQRVHRSCRSAVVISPALPRERHGAHKNSLVLRLGHTERWVVAGAPPWRRRRPSSASLTLARNANSDRSD
mmetsp:Transcript_59993/g.164430  ORF Transcript_59993/g.164430 Transcript_59993/m.164430 type:complete len:302 (+) Transcript_59993:884-1789(+)